MIKIKKIIFVIIISFFCLTKVNAFIKDSIFATVGNKAITHSDIVNEIKIILILNGQSYSEDKRTQLQTSAIQSAIKRNIKSIEIDKHELKYNQADLNREIEKLAVNANMDLDTLKNVFETNEIDFSIIVGQIRAELLWNSLIFKIYKERLSVNQNEIEEQLKLIQNQKEIKEYLISEIIIKPVAQENLESEIKKIKEKIEIEGFKNVAINLSISETALKGGDLGWINENVISKKFKSKIVNTPVGKVSEPIFLSEGILFFKVRDKRKLEEFKSLEEAKNQLINAEKTKILKMHSLSHYDNLRRTISINYF